MWMYEIQEAGSIVGIVLRVSPVFKMITFFLWNLLITMVFKYVTNNIRVLGVRADLMSKLWLVLRTVLPVSPVPILSYQGTST